MIARTAGLALVLVVSVAGKAAESPVQALAAVEATTGGRLGVVMLDARGRQVRGYRATERFAMCSTFKLLLAGMVLDGAARGSWSLDAPLALGAADIVAHSPVTAAAVAAGTITIGAAARAAVVVSDNAAANLLLRRIGGPAALTAWLRRHGDTVTRLDRTEPTLNENKVGDPRDTTTMAALAKTSSRLVFGDWLPKTERAMLRDWLVASQTGSKRIRAGLPAEWSVGDKTGTTDAPGRESYNDIAFIFDGPHAGATLAVFLDRSTVGGAASNAAIAAAARVAVR